MTKPSILIVEDDRIVAEDIKNRLKKFGFGVSGIVSSGEDALKKIEIKHPDIVLMDILLRGEMNGIEAASQIQSLFNTPVVYVTAYADQDVLDRAKVTEPFGYIVKPFEDRELKTTIEMALYKHKMETKLRQNEAWLSTVLRSIGDAVIATDIKGCITFMNPVAQSLTSWNEEDAVEKPLTDILNIINEQTRKTLENPVEKILRKGTVIGLANHTILIAKNGKEIPIDDSCAPIKDKNGKITGIVIIFSDITERKQAEKKLNERDEKLRAILAAVPDLMIVLDREGRMIEIFTGNPALLIAPLEDLLGRSIHEVMPEERSWPIQDVIDRTLNTGESQYYEYDLETEDGIKWFAGRTVSFKYKNLDHVFWSVRDISELKQAESDRQKIESQLRQSKKMESIGTLAGGIAHEFNNILGIMIGNTELAMDDVPDWNPAIQNLEEVKIAGLRAKDVIQQLLSFSRKSDQKRKLVKISPIIKDALKFLRSSLPTSIDIKKNILDDTGIILANPTQVHQVMINLCTNSVHAMSEKGGTLEVSLSVVEFDKNEANQDIRFNQGRYVKITVSDTGHGIAKEHLDKIFDPYFTTKEINKGSGIGLSVVHGIVKNYDGVISVESEYQKGTTINVFLPVVEKKIALEEETNTIIPKGNERILFVDDEISIVNMVHQILERLGYEVTTKTSSTDTLELFRTRPDHFDLIISDMTMPNMMGDRLAKEMLKIRPDIPIILCTGYSDRVDDEKTKSIGARAYVMKPVVKSELAKTIRKVLDVKTV